MCVEVALPAVFASWVHTPSLYVVPGLSRPDMSPHVGAATPVSQPPFVPIRAHVHLAQQLSSARKRAFKRAQTHKLEQCEPAQRCTGPTSYHAHRISMSSWSLPDSDLKGHRNPSLWYQRRILERRRNTPRLDELRGTPNAIHIMCTQETKWAQDTEYSNDRWSFVHSGTGSAAGGVLFVACRSIASQDRIKRASLIQGRALHLRVTSFPTIYQHAWSPKPKQHVTNPVSAERHGTLHNFCSFACHGVLDSIHTREECPDDNGNMSATLHTQLPHIGHGTAPHPHLVHPTNNPFSRWVSLGLNALNSWGSHGARSGTSLQFQCPAVQIGYLLARMPMML